MKAGLTRSQWNALLFIDSYVSEHGYSPNFDEIRVDAGLASKSGVHRIAHALVSRGYVNLTPAQARSIVLTEQGHRSVATFRSAQRETKSAPRADTQALGAVNVLSGNSHANQS